MQRWLIMGKLEGPTEAKQEALANTVTHSILRQTHNLESECTRRGVKDKKKGQPMTAEDSD